MPEVGDTECQALVNALNTLPGIRTTESCCGHGEHPFWIWTEADDLDSLRPIAYYLAVCHCGFNGWRLVVTTDCAMAPVRFLVEGPTGAVGYMEADHIASLIVEWSKTGV